MRRVKEILVSRSVASQLTKGFNDHWRARVHILGKDANGVIVKAVRIRNRHGCGNMPGDTPENTAPLIIPMLKKGLTICGLSRIAGADYSRNRPDGYNYGQWATKGCHILQISPKGQLMGYTNRAYNAPIPCKIISVRKEVKKNGKDSNKGRRVSETSGE